MTKRKVKQFGVKIRILIFNKLIDLDVRSNEEAASLRGAYTVREFVVWISGASINEQACDEQPASIDLNEKIFWKILNLRPTRRVVCFGF